MSGFEGWMAMRPMWRGPFEPHRGPGPASVDRLHHAETAQGDAPGSRIARAHPDDLGVGGRDGEMPDGDVACVGEDRLEGRPVVRRPPQPARARGDVEGEAVGRGERRRGGCGRTAGPARGRDRRMPRPSSRRAGAARPRAPVFGRGSPPPGR